MAQIEHDEAGHRFVQRFEDGDEAEVMYRRRGDVLDMYSVYVPPQHRNRGIAGRLVMHALDWAREHGCKIVPTCPFISGDFLPRFPQYGDLVARG
jgi:hypothetical protein